MSSLLTMLGAVARSKVDKLRVPDAPRPVRTAAPLGLTQGALVDIPTIEIAVAASDGAIMKPIKDMHQVVTAVGTSTIFGRTVVRSWLADGVTFIQTIVNQKDPSVADEVRLYTSFDEIPIADEASAEFWLGRYQRDKATGDFVRGSDGLGIIEEYGLIGWPTFDIQEPPTEFVRAWYPPQAGDKGVEPEEFNERIVLSDGSVSLVSYQGIEYVRTIGTAPTQTNEFLLAAYNEIDQGGGQNGAPNINLFVGIAVDPAALRVLKPST